MEGKDMKNNTLTPREIEVVNSLIKGYHNPKISELLCISEHTTKAHLSSIYEKLQVTNRIQAIIKFLKDDKILNLLMNKKDYKCTIMILEVDYG